MGFDAKVFATFRAKVFAGDDGLASTAKAVRNDAVREGKPDAAL
jgi:hypothetical protein